ACKDAGVLHAFFNDPETPCEGLHDVNDRVAHQDYGPRFDDEVLRPRQHGDGRSLYAREPVFRKFHYEKRFGRPFLCNAFDYEGTCDDDGDTGEVHERSDPAGFFEEDSRKQGYYRQFRSARHERRQHRCRAALAQVTDRPCRHDAWDRTSGPEDHGYDGPARKSDLLEITVHDDRHPAHAS